MRYVQLRAFYMVARRGGFSSAASAMGLTQPAVSDQVRKLEQDYDTLLFDRAHRHVGLTKAGRELLDIILPMFEHEARAHEFLSESRDETVGTLRIVADSPYHITRVLRRFRARYRAVNVVMTAGNAQRVVDDLGAYRAEIGVLGQDAGQSGLETIELDASAIVAFAARSFAPLAKGPVSLRALARLPLVFREKESRTRLKIEAAAKHAGVTLRPAIEAEGREAVREIVASGVGVGFVSKAEFGQDTRLRMIPLSDAVADMRESIVCLKRRRESRLIRAFMSVASRA